MNLKLLKDKYGKFIFFLFIIMIGGIFLYFSKTEVKEKEDLFKVTGTIERISKVLVYSNKIKHNERDSTFHIYLKEYPCFFQVSYFPYDKKEFYSKSKVGDTITLDIAKEEKDLLLRENERVRSFSLKVNSKTYLSAEEGLSGFGKGLFELGMIFIPLFIVTILILRTLQKK
jgi:hypothetical protein